MFLAISAFSHDSSFFTDPEIYRGLYAGHVVAGNVHIEEKVLGPGSAVVESISYVHKPTENGYMTSVMLTAIMSCMLVSQEEQGLYVHEFNTYLSADGMNVLFVSPAYSSVHAPDTPKDRCNFKEVSNVEQELTNK